METGGEGQGGYGGFQDAGNTAPAQQGFDGGNFESSMPSQDGGVIEGHFSEAEFNVNSHQEAGVEEFEIDEGQEITLDHPSNIVDFEAYKNAKEGEKGGEKEVEKEPEIQDQPSEDEGKMDPGHALTIAKNEGFEGALSYFATFGDNKENSAEQSQDEEGSAEDSLDETESEEGQSAETEDAPDQDQESDEQMHAGFNQGFGYDSELIPSDQSLPEADDDSENVKEDSDDKEEEEPEDQEPVAQNQQEEEPVMLDKPEIKELISALKDSNEIMKKMIERLEEQEKLNAETLLMLALLMKKLLEEKEKKDEEDKSLLATLMSVIGFLMSLFMDPEKETKKTSTEQVSHAA